MAEPDFIAAFRSALAEHNLFPSEIIPDGQTHRFSTKGKGDKAGWYVLFGDGVPAGKFGNWRTGLSQSWCAKNHSEMTNDELAEQQDRLVMAQLLREEDRAKRHEEARTKALAIWNSATPAPLDHPYLSRKQVQPHGTRVDADGKLLVPIYHFSDSGGVVLWAVQEVLGDGKFFHGGNKNFLTGSKKLGGFFPIGETEGDGQLYFCEGFATGASIHQATGAPVIVCFDAGNLDEVVSQWNDFHQDRPFIIAGDDDQYGAQNTGRSRATAVGKKYNCRVVFPKFKNLDKKPNDFNDLAVQEGIQTVRDQLGNGDNRDASAAKAVREKHPSASITICADNDRSTDGNPGVTKGRQVAEAIDATLVYPEGCSGSDFNDLATEKGLEEVKRQIDKVHTDATERADFLAKLDSILQMDDVEYESQRQKLSKDMGVRMSFLDDQRKKIKQEQEAAGSDEVVVEDDPWPEQVDGNALIHCVIDLFNRHIVLPEGADVAMSTWVVLTYCYDLYRVLPILGLVSPQKRCGKTTTIEVLTGLSYRSLPASNISPAAVFRSIEKFKPALFVDEADSFLKGNEELRGVLNSGHTKATAFVIRCDGENNDPKKFSTWGPKAIAAIGNLPGTIADRSVIVRLKRKSTNEKREKIGVEFDKQVPIIRRKILRWVTDNADHLKATISTVSFPGNDRATDNWAPLAAIAGAIGGEWPDRLAAASRAILDIKDDANDDLSILLLADIRDAFQTLNRDRIFSANLVNHLNGLDERPWGDLKGGKGLTTNVLARFLSPFEISSKKIRIGTEVKKGYMCSSFDDAFNRYLPVERGAQKGTQEHCNKNSGLCDLQKGTQKTLFPFEKQDNQLKSLGCSPVPFQEGGAGEDISKEEGTNRNSALWRTKI